MFKKILFTSLLLGLTFTINAQDWWGNKKIKGNGNVIVITRNISNFDEIAVGGSFDVILIKGRESELKIEGEENILPYLETEVSGGKLKIQYKKNTNIRTTRRLTVTVPFKNINKVSLGGSGKISSTEIIKTDNFSVNLGGSGSIKLKVDANETNASIGGSGNINLDGKTNDFICAIAGSGSIRAYELKTNALNAKVAGSGSIKTTVKSKIKAKLVGSGSIYYKGNPTHIDSKSVGSGDIIERN